MADREELFAEQMKKEAQSSMVFKIELYNCYVNVIERSRVLLEHKYMMNRFVRNDVEELATWVAKLFDFMKFMIKDKLDESSVTDKVRRKKLFEDLEYLAKGSYKVSEGTAVRLLEMKDFILEYLHECKITNLFLKKRNPADEFENEY